MVLEIDQGGNFRSRAEGDLAVTTNAAIAQAHIRSNTIMRLGLYALSALFMIVAAVVLVFAPPGKEAVSSIIAAALFVVAVGSAGFTAFRLKAPFVAAAAGSDSGFLRTGLPSDMGLPSGTGGRAGAGSSSIIDPP